VEDEPENAPPDEPKSLGVLLADDSVRKAFVTFLDSSKSRADTSAFLHSTTSTSEQEFRDSSKVDSRDRVPSARPPQAEKEVNKERFPRENPAPSAPVKTQHSEKEHREANPPPTVPAQAQHSEKGHREASPARTVPVKAQHSEKQHREPSPPVPVPIKAHRSEKENRESSERLGTPRPSASAKPTISFIYRIILSRSPIYSYKTWNPTRKLEETSLELIIEELGLTADVRGIIFTVEGPNFRAVEELLRDNETGFSSFVRQIKRVIRGLLTAGRGINSPLVFEMELEPIRGGDAQNDEEFDDDFTI
jgi:hypothetical protein